MSWLLLVILKKGHFRLPRFVSGMSLNSKFHKINKQWSQACFLSKIENNLVMVIFTLKIDMGKWLPLKVKRKNCTSHCFDSAFCSPWSNTILHLRELWYLVGIRVLFPYNLYMTICRLIYTIYVNISSVLYDLYCASAL